MEEVTKIHIYLLVNKSSHSSLINMLKDPDIKISSFKDINKIIKELKRKPSTLSVFGHKILIICSKSPLNNIIEIIQRIKEDPTIKTIPLFVISEFADKKDIREAYCNNLNGYIIKSNDGEKFKKIIDSFKELWLKNVKLPYN